MPFFPVLTLIFITLKLTHYIDWSWWWVLSPVSIPFAIALTMLTIHGILEGLQYIFSTEDERKIRKAISELDRLTRSLKRMD